MPDASKFVSRPNVIVPKKKKKVLPQAPKSSRGSGSGGLGTVKIPV